MRHLRLFLFLLLGVLTFSLSSCEAMAGIFKTGAFTGIIAIVLVIALLLFIIGKIRGGNDTQM